MKIVIDSKIPYIKGALDSLADVVYVDGSAITAADVRDADALIVRTRTRCDATLLAGSRVSAIFTATIGFDHIDTDYCAAHSIHWQNAPGCNAASVRQYVMSVFAYMHRRLGTTLAGARLAVVGVGNVGRQIVELALNLGMEVMPVDPVRARREPTEYFYGYRDALSRADIITYHTPLTLQGRHRTFHLFGPQVLPWLRKGVCLINTSRGDVVDQEALRRAMLDGTVAHAVLDVWHGEPDIDPWLLDNALLATPHIAGYSADSKWNGTMMSVRALSRHFGLGLDDWTPQPLPQPDTDVVDVCGQRSFEDAFSQAMLDIYDVGADCSRPRAEPDKFEDLRGHYPLRRESKAYWLRVDKAYAGRMLDFGLRLKMNDDQPQ